MIKRHYFSHLQVSRVQEQGGQYGVEENVDMRAELESMQRAIRCGTCGVGCSSKSELCPCSGCFKIWYWCRRYEKIECKGSHKTKCNKICSIQITAEGRKTFPFASTFIVRMSNFFKHVEHYSNFQHLCVLQKV